MTAVGDVSLSIGMFSGAWRQICTGAPGTVISPGEGIEYIFSGIPVPFFNVGLLTARDISSPELERLAREAVGFASDKNAPWLLVSTRETLAEPEGADAVLDACGFSPLMPMTGMVADDVPSGRVPPDLTLSVPSDARGRAAILDVNSAAYAMDLSAGRQQVEKPEFWGGGTPVLGTVGDTPVASAAVLMVDGVRYVALVATDPAHQRRGYADAAMRHALALAAEAHGPCPTLLHATDAGRPVYERMGYRPISSHMVYLEKRFLGDH